MQNTITRQEHLDWCKKRALQYVDIGENQQAFASFTSDIGKHEETKDIRDTVVMLGMPLLMSGLLTTPQQMREHIQGYN